MAAKEESDNDEAASAARQERAERLRRRIGRVADQPDAGAAQRPDESDAEYVQRRMREIERKRSRQP